MPPRKAELQGHNLERKLGWDNRIVGELNVPGGGAEQLRRRQTQALAVNAEHIQRQHRQLSTVIQEERQAQLNKRQASVRTELENDVHSASPASVPVDEECPRGQRCVQQGGARREDVEVRRGEVEKGLKWLDQEGDRGLGQLVENAKTLQRAETTASAQQQLRQRKKVHGIVLHREDVAGATLGLGKRVSANQQHRREGTQHIHEASLAEKVALDRAELGAETQQQVRDTKVEGAEEGVTPSGLPRGDVIGGGRGVGWGKRWRLRRGGGVGCGELLAGQRLTLRRLAQEQQRGLATPRVSWGERGRRVSVGGDLLPEEGERSLRVPKADRRPLRGTLLAAPGAGGDRSAARRRLCGR